MSLNVSKCLADAVQQGRLTEAQARKAEGKVLALVAKGLPEAEAVARAATELQHEAQRTQRQAALRVIAAQRTVEQAESHPKGFTAGVAALFARDLWGRAGYSNVEGRAQAITAAAHARLAHLLDAYRTKALGLHQDLPGLRRFVRALYGGAGDPEAAGFAKAWADTTDALVERFNAAGGDLARREDWRLPQLWNHRAVKQAGEGEFTAFMQGELERGGLRIRDFDTGEAVDAARARAIIAEAYARIESNGMVDLVPGQAGGGSVANSRNQVRAFEWTDADAWLRFNDRFGEGDGGIFDMLVGHVAGLSRDIAMMEILGPNPAHMARFLVDTARKRGAGEGAAHLLENVWNQVNGRAASPVNEFVANVAAGVRSWLTSAQLGSAVLSSVTDFATIRQTALWNGLPAAGIMRRYVDLLKPSSAEDRRVAVTLGLIAEGWTTRALGATRHQMEVVGRDLAGRVAEVVMRGSGMAAHTQAAKWAFGMEFSAHLAARADRAMEALEPELRRTMARYGITPEDWDAIRTRGVWEHEGARFIHPEQVVTGPARPSGFDGEGRDALWRDAQGRSELGMVPDIGPGIPAGPIRLRRGWHDDATAKGSGFLHMQVRREGQIADVAAFAAEVAATFNEVRRDTSGSLFLVRRDPARQGRREPQSVLVVRLTPDGEGGYNIETAGRWKNDYLAKRELLWEGERLAPNQPAGPVAASDAPGPGMAGSPTLPSADAQSTPTMAADAARFNRAASRLLEMINGETRFAVVEPGAPERALMLGSSRPGTLGGEFRRATAQYKSFPIAMMSRHLMRGLDAIQGGDHGRYLAGLMVSLTITGAFGLQMKQISQGRDPRDMADARFWGSAFLQGGGAGILGDFLYAGLNRADRGFYMTAIGGPTAGLVDDLVRLTGGNIQAVAENRDSNFGAELARFVQRNTPGTSLWYSRLAMDRLMWERLHAMADPEAPQRWRRMERRALEDYGQDFFWAPGRRAPERAPDPAAAFGPQP